MFSRLCCRGSVPANQTLIVDTNPIQQKVVLVPPPPVMAASRPQSVGGLRQSHYLPDRQKGITLTASSNVDSSPFRKVLGASSYQSQHTVTPGRQIYAVGTTPQAISFSYTNPVTVFQLVPRRTIVSTHPIGLIVDKYRSRSLPCSSYIRESKCIEVQTDQTTIAASPRQKSRSPERVSASNRAKSLAKKINYQTPGSPGKPKLKANSPIKVIREESSRTSSKITTSKKNVNSVKKQTTASRNNSSAKSRPSQPAQVISNRKSSQKPSYPSQSSSKKSKTNKT